MATQGITIQLDDETLSFLAALGEPTVVLAQMARAAADGARRFGHPRRSQTDRSLQLERDNADVALGKTRGAAESEADSVLRVARLRADQVMQAARVDADNTPSPSSTTAEASSDHNRSRAADILEHERLSADALLEHERAEARRHQGTFLAVDRESTDHHLSGERAQVDTMVGDQREANQQMVVTTVRAQELVDEADSAKERAEKSEQELRAVAEFREMFIGILGHDLRNPLTSIVSAAAYVLRHGHLDDRNAEMVARIIRGSQRMTRMIAQLLDLTRARLCGGLQLELKPADLREICQQVVEELEPALQLDVKGDVTGLWDGDRLAEVVSNLAGNAIQYATAGTPVSVNVHAVGAEVVVEICNQGDPIPPDLLPSLFEPFRRGRPREKSASGNLGLGLYIAHQIVLAHGGTLDVRSANGTTTFSMRLPRGQSA